MVSVSKSMIFVWSLAKGGGITYDNTIDFLRKTLRHKNWYLNLLKCERGASLRIILDTVLYQGYNACPEHKNVFMAHYMRDIP